MADVTAKSFDQMESGLGGMFVRARAELGVSSFGMQVIDLPAGTDTYPEHAHEGSASQAVNHGQEEVYVPLEGRATLLAGEERFDLQPGMAVRVGPAQMRKVVPVDGAFRMLALGGLPGKPYQALPFSETGAGDTPPQPPR